MLEGSAITAVLGPTNTGKTHRAVERMLTYDTGIIGLPLRLLAREVYDRLTSRLGEGAVALVTGEEKRIPRSPAYWVCTVEAMPVDREVDFVAVDEIQLAANAQRGHVFTERLLSARGRRETWFLGAETMRDALAELVPAARVVTHPRLSQLKFRGMDRMGRVPPRSALIAFSAAQVFELGERLRASRGGAAVVMGAPSPRTRNAQVAMFQAGEVDHLVATDAVGMGLNLHVGHVAFAALRKFDGRNVRDLDPAELAQIAGRAGRYLNDGTFGTLDPLFLPDDTARAIEGHRFAQVARLVWRTTELDFGSPAQLLASLRQRPPARRLRLVEDAEDSAALTMLMTDERVTARARGEEAVRLLWDVCRIPDFRKLSVETHAALLTDIFLELTGPLRGAEALALSAPARGILYQLEQGLGTALASAASSQLADLSTVDREGLVGRGIVLGAHLLYVPRLLARPHVEHRLALLAASHERVPRMPGPGVVSVPRDDAVEESAYLALGFPVLGPRAVRADVADRVAGALASVEAPEARTLSHWMGCSKAAAERIAAALRPLPPPHENAV